MIPVDQTRVGKLVGNCMPASIASVLEIPLELVDFGPLNHEDEYSPAFDNALARFGLIGTEITADEETMKRLDEVHPGRAWVVGVTNPRGVKHAVVWQHGRIAHDPNPLRDCMDAKIETVLFITPSSALAHVRTCEQIDRREDGRA